MVIVVVLAVVGAVCCDNIHFGGGDSTDAVIGDAANVIGKSVDVVKVKMLTLSLYDTDDDIGGDTDDVVGGDAADIVGRDDAVGWRKLEISLCSAIFCPISNA